MIKRITLRDIAQTAGVHFTTVSRALKNHEGIPEKTREKLKELAKEMGYVPDPALAALSAYRMTHRTPAFHGTLAWISHDPIRKGWEEQKTFRNYYTGASERAAELGYKLDDLWINEAGMSSAKASRILRARNITGLLIAPMPKPRGRAHLDWKSFSAVAFGRSLVSPKLHVVTTSQYRSTLRLLRKLRSLGYRRMGFISSNNTESRLEHAWSAAFLIEQQRAVAQDRIPILIAENTFDPNETRRWIEKYHPDVIIFDNAYIIKLLNEWGYRVPEDIGVALVSIDGAPVGVAGIYENSHYVGAMAVDFLVGMIHRQERGVPLYQQTQLIEGIWNPGTTVRRLNS